MTDLHTRLYHLASRFRTSVYYTFQGTCSKEQLKFLVLGNDMPYRFYPRLMRNYARPRIRKIRNYDIEKTIASSDADVMIFHSPEHLLPQSLEVLALPEHVNMELPIKGTYEEYVRALPGSAQSDVEKVRKAGFIFRVSHDPADLESFYSDYYIPARTLKYREDSYIYPIEYVRNHFRNGFLLTVSKGDGPFLAANLVRRMKNHLWVKFSGVRGGSAQIRKSGVNSALTLETIRMAHESGCTHVDFGISLPFRSDSAFIYKEKWGNETHLPPFKTTSIRLAFKDSRSKRLFWKHASPVTYADTPESLSKVAE